MTLQKNHHYIFISCQCQVSFPLMKWSEGPVRRVLPNSHAEATECAQRLVRVLFIPRAFQVPGVYQKNYFNLVAVVEELICVNQHSSC